MHYFHLLLAALTALVHADCECGYSVNNTNNLYFGLFTSALETDFLHLTDASSTGTEMYMAGWQPQEYHVPAQAAHGDYGKEFQVGNVIANPMSEGKWNGDAIGVGDPGLQMWVRSEVQDGLVPVSEIASVQKGMLYGSFRAGIKMTAINGTCGALFWYRNDTREIDIEFLSKKQSEVNQIVQTPETAAKSGDTTNAMDSQAFISIFELGEGYHDYRFDWLPGRIDFYLDDQKTRTYTEDIPSSPGHLLLSHWSNGNAGWSAGPPKQDAAMTVSYVKAYFNTSSREVANIGCTDLAAPGSVCNVPDQISAPDPARGGGNTTFLTLQLENTESTSPTATSTWVTSLPTSAAEKIELLTRGIAGGIWGYFIGFALSMMIREYISRN